MRKNGVFSTEDIYCLLGAKGYRFLYKPGCKRYDVHNVIANHKTCENLTHKQLESVTSQIFSGKTTQHLEY